MMTLATVKRHLETQLRAVRAETGPVKPLPSLTDAERADAERADAHAAIARIHEAPGYTPAWPGRG